MTTEERMAEAEQDHIDAILGGLYAAEVAESDRKVREVETPAAVDARVDGVLTEIFRLQSSHSVDLIARFRALNIPVIAEGLTGGSHGTDCPYTDHRVGGNVIRVTGTGWNGQNPTISVIA